jgi:hypothetical protein
MKNTGTFLSKRAGSNPDRSKNPALERLKGGQVKRTITGSLPQKERKDLSMFWMSPFPKRFISPRMRTMQIYLVSGSYEGEGLLFSKMTQMRRMRGRTMQNIWMNWMTMMMMMMRQIIWRLMKMIIWISDSHYLYGRIHHECVDSYHICRLAKRKLTIPLLRWQNIMNAFIVIIHANLYM